MRIILLIILLAYGCAPSSRTKITYINDPSYTQGLSLHETRKFQQIRRFHYEPDEHMVYVTIPRSFYSRTKNERLTIALTLFDAYPGAKTVVFYDDETNELIGHVDKVDNGYKIEFTK